MDAINSLLSSVPVPFVGQSESNDAVSTAEDFLSALEQTDSPNSRSEVTPDRVEEMASEFESVFLSMLLKEMRNTLDQENGGLFGGDESDTFGGMFDLFMSQHLAEASPLGISDAVSSYLANVPQS
jgi:flagellar protein FlgJ